MQLTDEDLIPPQELDDLLAASPLERVIDYDDDAVAERRQRYLDDVQRDEDERDAQDDVEGLGAGGDPRKPKAAVALGRDWILSALFVGIGYCLRTMRMLFNVDPLWLDAETAWEEAAHKHPQSDPMKIPWGVLVWWTNGRHGHVALSIGRGWCITTDYLVPGRLCIARISALGPWCGGTLRGWTEDVNGVVIWKPKTKPEPWGIDERIATVRRVYVRAVKAADNERRIKGLKKWLDRLEDRRDKLAEKGQDR